MTVGLQPTPSTSIVCDFPTCVLGHEADAFTQKAAELILSGALADALDFRKESPRTREAYGIQGDSDEKQIFILARRLIEAGVRVVSLQYGGWDTHHNNLREMERKLPGLDLGLNGLLTDLHNRGLLDDTLVMVSTEFGRSPRMEINSNPAFCIGRTHCPSAGTFLLSGGGIRMGQVVGSTNRLGEHPEDRPVHLQELFATVYHQLGIDVQSVQLHDLSGRPHYILEKKAVVHELI